MLATRRLTWCLALACATGCATTARPPLKVDLTSARTAVEEARQAGAPERAADSFARAEAHLKEAEGAVARGGPEGMTEARHLADVAVAEATCATGLARLSAEQVAVAAAAAKSRAPGPDVDRLNARLRRAEEEQRRMEDRVGLLVRDLEVTETELIRSKARLKGNETKAEASAAIAEARTLARRLDQDKGRSSTLARCRESLAKAEEQLLAGNYGAAIFFAMKAQDTATKSQETTGETRPEAVAPGDTPPPQPSYVARSAVNIRKGPAATEAVVGKAPARASLAAVAARGDWVKVSYQGVTGWVRRDLLQ
jgi:uncharacterized protein YgiM (DUF1202 family)